MQKRKKIIAIFLFIIVLGMLLTTRTQSTEQEGEYTDKRNIILNTSNESQFLFQELETTSAGDHVENAKTEVVKPEENKPIVELTQEELETLYRLVFAEDGIEDEECQVAVAAVYLNRLLSECYSDDFFEVLHQKNAFSSVKNGKIYIMTEHPYEVTLDMVPEVTKRAVQRALNGEDPIEEELRAEAQRLGLDEDYYAANGAFYYYNPKACSKEALNARDQIQVKVKFGLHYYYKVWD